LRADRFLQRERKKSPQGWVAFDILKTFKKLSAATDGDVELMIEGARASSDLAVSEDGESVGRVKELPVVDDSATRTVYVEGIGEAAQVEDLEKVMGEYGKICYVSIPRITVTESHVSETGQHEPQRVVRKSMGYCFVEFSVAEDANKAAKAGGDGGVVLQGNALRVMAKSAWEKSKQDFKNQQKSQRAVKSEQGFERAHGAMVRFEGGRGPLSRLEMREAFEAFAPVANTDLSDVREGEEAKGYVRFETPAGARLCVHHMKDRGQRLGGAKISVGILSIAEEKDYIVSCGAAHAQASTGADSHKATDTKSGHFTAGVLVSFRTKPDTPSTVDYRSLRKAISAVDKVEFLEYDGSSHSGCARMSSASGAVKVCGAFQDAQGGEGSKPFDRERNGAMVHVEEWRLLEGDEEKEYWSKVLAAKLARKQDGDQGPGKQKQAQSVKGDDANVTFKGSHSHLDQRVADGAGGGGTKRQRESVALKGEDGQEGDAKRHRK